MSHPERGLALAHPNMPDPSVLRRIADRLRDAFDAERILVFGSTARGEATIHSDIDLLVIAPTAEAPYWRMARARAAARELSFDLPISPIVVTPAEVEQRLRRGDAFLSEVLDHGIDL